MTTMINNETSSTWTTKVINKLSTYLINNDPSEVQALAYPGLITLLDIALYRSNEGSLTKTISAANIILKLFFKLKVLGDALIEKISESYCVSSLDGDGGSASILPASWIELGDNFGRLCLECAMNAIERLSTDRLASSANLCMDTYGSSSGASSSSSGGGGGIGSSNGGPSSSSNSNTGSGGGIDPSEGVLESINTMDYTRSNKTFQHLRRIDLWESPRLFCCDYIWADDAYTSCHKLIRLLIKHRFLSSMIVDHPCIPSPESTSIQIISDAIVYLLTNTLPTRLHQFRVAVDADALLTKRLYLIKCEYRAPFRSFLEAHATLQRAPRLELIQDYLTLHIDEPHEVDHPTNLESKTMKAEHTLSSLLENSILVDALKYEQQCEIVEVDMARMLFPFSELARFVDMKKAHLVAAPPFILNQDLSRYRELLRRLKLILTRKVGQETTTGIRPILLDLQDSPRDFAPSSTSPFEPISTTTSLSNSNDNNNTLLNQRLQIFTTQLQILTQICKKKGAFVLTDKRELDIPSNILRDCTSNLDTEMFIAQYNDWYTMIQLQHQLFSSSKETTHEIQHLSEQLRQAEIEVSIAKTATNNTTTSLLNVKQRIEHCEKDRMNKFDICCHVLKDVCKREMNLKLDLVLPDKDLILELPNVDHFSSYCGIFGGVLLENGDVLP